MGKPSAPAPEGNAGHVSRRALPTNSNPRKAEAWTSAGPREPCPLETGPWAQLLSAGLGGSWCPWRSALSADSPAREPPALWNEHKAMLGLPCPAAPGRHVITQKKEQCMAVGKTPWEGKGHPPRGGIRIHELVPQPSGSHALRLLQPPWIRAGPRAVTPGPCSAPLAQSHCVWEPERPRLPPTCLPPSMAGVRTHTGLNPRLRRPSSPSRE